MTQQEFTKQNLVRHFDNFIEPARTLTLRYPEGNYMASYLGAQVKAMSEVRQTIEDNIIFTHGLEFRLQCRAVIMETDINRQAAELWMEAQKFLPYTDGTDAKAEALGAHSGFHFSVELLQEFCP